MSNYFRHSECPHCKAEINNETVLGLSNGSSIWAWRCRNCGHEWLRHSFVRERYKLNDKTAIAAPTPHEGE